MGFIIIRSSKYIKVEANGQYHCTKDKEEATEFASAEQVTSLMKKISAQKRKGCLIVDVDNQKQYKYKSGMLIVRNRSQHGPQIRQYIYDKANGRCELCGRKLLFNEMTLDHIKPLAMGGRDEIANLQCSCKACNTAKGSLLPEDYMEWIRGSFICQMGKINGRSWRYKLAMWAVKGIFT